MNISELNLSVRSENLLRRNGINEVEILLSMTDNEIVDLLRGFATAEICEAIKPLRGNRGPRFNDD